MKRILLVSIFVLAVFAAYFSGTIGAQQAAPEPVLKRTKVGVVDFGVVFRGYDGTKALVEKLRQPYEARKKELETTILLCEKVLKNTDGNATEDDVASSQKIITESKGKLVDLEKEYKDKASARLESDMGAEISKELNEQIRRHAEKHGFHLILAYIEPRNDESKAARIFQRIGTMDKGGIAEAYAVEQVDISADVLKNLNELYRMRTAGKNAMEGGSR